MKLGKQAKILAIDPGTRETGRNAALLNVLFDEIQAIGRRRGIPVKSLGHSTVKKIVCGNGRASKEEVARVIVSRFPELKVYLTQDRKWKQRYHENMFDAVALGLAYLSIRTSTEKTTRSHTPSLVRHREAARSTP